MTVQTTQTTAVGPRPEPKPAPPKASSRWWWVALLIALGAAGGGYYWYAEHGHRTRSKEALDAAATEAATEAAPAESRVMKVEATYPRRGGTALTTTQPGSVHAFESADLYAEVPGYLKSQKVDIGDRVKEGEVLAEIAAPELEKAVLEAQAAVKQAEAAAVQAKARIASTKADLEAQKAMVSKAKVDVESYTAARQYREKEFSRIRDLAAREAIERKLVDEQEDRYHAALAAEHAAQQAVVTAEAQVTAAKAKVEQAEADYEAAKADIDKAKASLHKAEVYVEFTKIRSPYTGVVTRRSFHRGDLIRAAISSSGRDVEPVLSVARTDLMRVVLKMPDNFVPLTDRGDPAEVRVDALPGYTFSGRVSRFADTEDPADRTMRTEVDLPNDKGLLHEGMYGGVTITLAPPSKDLAIPSTAVAEQKEGGAGVVWVVRNGEAHKATIQVGRDNGVEVEVVKGLKPDDQVIVQYNGALAEGTPVQVETVDISKVEEKKTH
jgi:HlyD family secretion protein